MRRQDYPENEIKNETFDVSKKVNQEIHKPELIIILSLEYTTAAIWTDNTIGHHKNLEQIQIIQQLFLF